MKDGNLQIWGYDFKLQHEFCVGILRINGIFVLPDNKIIVYGSYIKICDCDGHIVELIGHTDSIGCICMFNDKIVTGSNDTTLKVWNLH